MRGFVGMFAIDVADGQRFNKAGGQFGDALSFAAAANESEIRLVIGRLFFHRLVLCQGLFHEPSRQSGGQTEGRRGFQKGPARKRDRFHSHDSLQVSLYLLSWLFNSRVTSFRRHGTPPRGGFWHGGAASIRNWVRRLRDPG